MAGRIALALSFGFFLSLCFPPGVKARDFEPLFQKICREAGVSKELAMTIARQESGMNPLAVNVAGRAYFPRTAEEARRIIQTAQITGRSYDVGLMQVNRRWIELWKIAPETLLEPEAAIRAGVRILAGEIARHGVTWKAVGRYHSPGEERGRGYAWRIYEAANGHSGRRLQGGKEGNGHAKQKAGTQGILLYRRNATDSGSGEPGGIVRFRLR
jgi:hypothetical protein